MLHTLLPAFERKTLRREYRVRAAIVACFALACAGLVGIAALFPALIHASLQEASATADSASLKKTEDKNGMTGIQAGLTTSNKLLAALSDKEPPRLSSVADSVISARGAMQIRSLSLSRTATTTVTMVIQGLAPTRDGLLAFKSRLEEIVPGNKVDLPIDELAKSSDIQFSIQMTETLP